jgi:multiple sugar transport system ATP-binding protein
MAALSIHKVQKRYGNVQILRGIDLAIADGEFLILVGPSGCGKSTLLNMIAGLEDISEGDIVIGERRVNDLSPKDRDIAMVFQSYALYPSMTVQENIEFGMRMKKVPKAERQAVVSRVAKTLQIEPLLARRPAQLSGGQRQRVAMGRALARNPAIFLFDEPLSNLDAKLRVEMRAEIKALHQRLRSTIVYVTHDQVEAMTLGDRIAVMKDGLVQQFGTPAEIYERPVNMYVAGFIGSPTMNFVQAQLQHAGGAWSARLDGLPDALPLRLSPEDASGGASVILGLRPEHFHLTTPHSQGAVPVVVELTEPTGADTFIAGRLGGQKITLRCSPKDLLRPGDTAWFDIDADAISLFDPKTQLRLQAIHSPLN